MARKRRAGDIDEARDGLGAESLLPIAQALRDAIDAKLSGEGASGPVDIEAAYDAALSVVAEAIIASRLEGLDAEQVLRLYAEQVGDDVLREKLGRWATAKADELDARERLEALRREAARTGRLALDVIDEGSRVTVYLFEPIQISQARRDGSIPPARTIALRLLDPSSGRAEVVSDTTLSRGSHERLPVQTRGTIGSLVVDGERRALEPALQRHAPLGHDFGDGPASTAEVIGFVDVGDGLPLLG